MNPLAWTKIRQPVFEATKTMWGVGHCGFTQSPDGSEDWLVFHAKLERRPNWNRAVHIQRFTWNGDGVPVFGAPVTAGTPIAVPSGQNAPQETSVAFGRAVLAAAMGEEPLVKEVNITEVNSSSAGVPRDLRV